MKKAVNTTLVKVIYFFITTLLLIGVSHSSDYQEIDNMHLGMTRIEIESLFDYCSDRIDMEGTITLRSCGANSKGGAEVRLDTELDKAIAIGTWVASDADLNDIKQLVENRYGSNFRSRKSGNY